MKKSKPKSAETAEITGLRSEASEVRQRRQGFLRFLRFLAVRGAAQSNSKTVFSASFSASPRLRVKPNASIVREAKSQRLTDSTCPSGPRSTTSSAGMPLAWVEQLKHGS